MVTQTFQVEGVTINYLSNGLLAFAIQSLASFLSKFAITKTICLRHRYSHDNMPYMSTSDENSHITYAECVLLLHISIRLLTSLHFAMNF